MTKTEMMMILGPALAGGVGSLVNSRQQSQQNQMTMADRQMQALQQKAQVLQGLQQNRQQMAQSGLNAMPLGQEQAYASRAKAMQALLPALAQYQGARPTDPGIAGATRSGGPNLVQALAGNQGFQNTFSDQMTSQAMADRRKAIAQVNPQYEFSSLGGFGMDPAYDQTVDDARGTALARLKGFEGQQQALADQQVQMAMNQSQQQQQEKKGGGVGGFLGGLLKTAAPFAAFIPGVGPLAAVGLGAAGGALGNKLQGGGFVSGAVQGGIGAGLGAAGKSLASGQGLNPFNNGMAKAGAGTVAGTSMNQLVADSMSGPSFAPSAPYNAAGDIQSLLQQPQSSFKQGPQGPPQTKLPMFNKADPRSFQIPPSQFGPGLAPPPPHVSMPPSGPMGPTQIGAAPSGFGGRQRGDADYRYAPEDMHPAARKAYEDILNSGLGRGFTEGGWNMGGVGRGALTAAGPAQKALPPGQYEMGPATPPVIPKQIGAPPMRGNPVSPSSGQTIPMGPISQPPQGMIGAPQIKGLLGPAQPPAPLGPFNMGPISQPPQGLLTGARVGQPQLPQFTPSTMNDMSRSAQQSVMNIIQTIQRNGNSPQMQPYNQKLLLEAQELIKRVVGGQ